MNLNTQPGPTSGGLGLRGTTGSFSHSTTKGGVLSMTRQLAVEMGPQGLRVNAIAPGVIQTPPVEPMLANQAVLDTFLAKIPLRRLGQPAEIANAALFLASDEAGFVTGSTLVVDGGESAG
jgi:NAD(P)-dependent dehydrogenase (short-subunit alcohol dehydrogenase family)